MTADHAIKNAADFGWLINGFVRHVPGVTHALVLSSDGFPLTASESVSSDGAEQLAAIASGLLGLARNSAALFGKGSCELIMIRLSRGYFLFMGIGENAGLAVLTSARCDMKAVAYEMTQFVDTAAVALTEGSSRPAACHHRSANRLTTGEGATVEHIVMRSKRIRLYALTGGRTRPRHHLLVETLISVPHYDPQLSEALMPESQALYQLARETTSIAEMSAHLTIPGVIRVLISDLAAQDLVVIHPTGFTYQYDRIILERILAGLKKLPASCLFVDHLGEDRDRWWFRGG